MRVLVACEYSGRVRDAFLARGHNAMSCDLLPTERPGPHYQGDVRHILHYPWDLVIAFPDCTYLCGSGWHWVARGRVEDDGRPRIEHVNEALAFARMFIDGPETAHIPKRVVENPVGVLSRLVRKPDQIIQPWWFGDDASKKNMPVAGKCGTASSQLEQSCLPKVGLLQVPSQHTLLQKSKGMPQMQQTRQVYKCQSNCKRPKQIGTKLRQMETQKLYVSRCSRRNGCAMGVVK